MDTFEDAIRNRISGLNAAIDNIAGQVELRHDDASSFTVVFVRTCDLTISASGNVVFPTPSYDVKQMKIVSDLFSPSTSGYQLLGVACRKRKSSDGQTKSFWHLRFRD